ncbi:PA14 domain-containing protein [Cohnella faecalis]|uniref:PA14 domain-containing protein n=1 Tax=Cohnella faecalis TaxID=2315694 RepID=A0A398CN26_9BACL|nr:PA14 domain-containing protein [Cohnella faecalis]RIE03692.1 hypothetical protein D3H35_10360 [Cohnella faecalis]
MNTAKRTFSLFMSTIMLGAALFVLPKEKAVSAEPVNLALNKPISATSFLHSAAEANDGKAQTYFESVYTLPQALTVDLGSGYAINKAILKLPPTFPDRTITLAIQGSADNVTYTDLVASSSYSFQAGAGNSVTVTFPTGAARYVRLTFTGNTSRTSAQLAELELYADNSAADLVVTDISSSPANPVEGQPVTFSAVVKNIGQSATASGVGHTVAFKIDGTTIAVTSPYAEPIAPGGSATLTASGTWSGERYKFDIQAVANANGAIGETNAVNNDDYSEEITVRGAGWQNNFNIKDAIGIYDFPEQLIGYPLDFAGQNVTPAHIRLRQYGQSTPLIYQLSDVVVNGSGYLTSATLHFRTGLNIGGMKRFVVDEDNSYTPSFANEVSLTDNGDGTATISGNQQQLKVPYGNVNANGAELSQVPAPILAVSRQPGAWIGAGSFAAPAGTAVSHWYGRAVEQGPLFIEYQVTYTLADGRVYDALLTIRHNEKYVTVDEKYSGFLSSQNAYLRFSYKNGVDPNGRMAMQNGGYSKTSSGGRSGGYGDGADTNGKLPYELGIYAVNSNSLIRSTSFWNDAGDNAILFAANRLKDWKTESRQTYNAYIKQNLRFYNKPSDKYMEASIEGTERHWALSVIPRSEEVLSGRRLSDMTKPADILIDSEWTNIPTSTGLQPGTAPDVKLWQKLADFSLDGYKDMVFDFPEDASMKLPIPGYGNVTIADPNDYWTDKYCFACFKKYYNLTDKYWDISSDLGPTGNFGRAERYFFSDYAFNRANWGYDERKRTRSLFVFIAYTAEDDNNLPHTSMLGGHPNFNLDVKQVLALAAGAFPGHPHAAAWKSAYLQDFNESLSAFMRKGSGTYGTTGGRWYENLPTYANASLTAMIAAQASLLQYDGTDIFANDNFKTFARWLLNAMSPNERATYRTPVPIGAHASGGDPGGEFDGIYKLLADRVIMGDSVLGGQLLWSATNGAQGTSPALKSAVYQDYGPIMRYDFGGSRETFLYLQQLRGPGYRWFTAANGAIYYATKGKRYSWNGGEESGDLIDINKLPIFTLNGNALGESPTDGVLYDFGDVQYYKALANTTSAPYLSRSVMMVRDEFIGLYDDVGNTTSDGSFLWTNRDTGLKAQYYNNMDFTDLKGVQIDNKRFPGTSWWGAGAPIPAIDPDTYSIAWTGKIFTRFSEPYTFTAAVGTGDTAKVYVNGVLAADTAAGTTTPVPLVANQLYDIRIEYVHNTGPASMQWKWSSPSQSPSNVEGIGYLSNELDQYPNIYEVKAGPGDEFHLVAPDAIPVTNKSYGALVRNNEYVFTSDTTQNVTEGSAVFQGKVGYASPQQLVLIDGTKIGYKDLVLERSGGEFGASVSAAGADSVQGRIVGRSGGTVTVTLPNSFTAAAASVTINGVVVPSSKSGNKMTFNVSIAQNEGVKTYEIAAVQPLFSDTFEDGEADGWTVTAGTWNIANDGATKVYRSAGNGSSTSGSTVWTNYTIKANVKQTGNAAMTSDVIGRYTDGNHFYFLQLDGVGNRLKLYKKVASSVTLLKSVPFTVNRGQWYSMQLGMSGSTLTGSVDGNTLITVSDGELTSGRIGLRSSAETIFDDITVY